MPPFKDSINTATVTALARRLASVGGFPQRAFVAEAAAGLDALELKARVAHVVATLQRHLPEDFTQAADLVEAAVAGSDLGMWEAWPATDWVAAAGLHDPERALALLARVTPHASAEMALRPFIHHHTALTLRTLREWTRHRDHHVRRLVSESSRPRLPWAPRIRVLEREPHLTVPLLDALREDGSDYVRRSVANHLNDLNKLAPDLALDTAARWRERGGANVDWVLRQGLRTLVKAGDKRALGLIGCAPADIELRAFVVATPVVRLGDALEFSFTVRSREHEPIRAVVDYVIHHRKANGTNAAKVFKLSMRDLPPGADVVVRRRHPMRLITTRRYYGGEHRVEVQVNGHVLGGDVFDVVVDDA